MLGHRTLEPSEYVAILKRHRLLILGFVIVFPILGGIVTKFIPPKFMSQTLVIIEQQKVPGEYVTPVIESNLDGRLASMKEQILSRSRIQPIIERYNLYGNTGATLDDKVDLARKSIDVKPIHSAIAANAALPGFFITFTASDAKTAQLVCGEITNLFMNENLRSREAAAEGTTDFLKGQLLDAKKNLDEQDAKLAAFQTRYFGKLPGEEGQNNAMMNSLNSQLDATSQQLAQLQQNKTYLQSLIAQNELAAPRSSASSIAPSAASAAAAQTPEGMARERRLRDLQQHESDLLNEYTPSHPDVVAVRRQIADVKKEMAAAAAAMGSPSGETHEGAPVRQFSTESPAVQQLRAQLSALEAGIREKEHEQEVIQARQGQYAARIQSSPQVEEEYKELTRDYNTAQKFYDELLTKMNHSKEATDLERRQEGEQFRVMDEPNLPDTPSFPKLWTFALGGLVLGLGLGGGIVALLEYRDTSLRTEKDVWAFTRLPTLGIISIAGTIPVEQAAPQKRNAFQRHTEVKTGKDSLAGARG